MRIFEIVLFQEPTCFFNFFYFSQDQLLTYDYMNIKIIKCFMETRLKF